MPAQDLQEQLTTLRAKAAEARKQEARAEATAEALRAKVAEAESALREEFGDEYSDPKLLDRLREEAADKMSEAEARLAEAEGS